MIDKGVKLDSLKICVAWMLIGVLPWIAMGQEDELDLIDRVTELQKQLESKVAAEHERAESELIELGPPILDYLESATEESTTDYRQRLQRIRTRLEKVVVNSVTKASSVKASGKMTVGALLKQIKQQTGNDIGVADDSLLDLEVDVSMDGLEFWQALEQLMSRTKLGIDRYGSANANQLMLGSVNNQPTDLAVPTSIARIFQAQITRVDSSVNLADPQLDFTTVNLLVRWEPRLRPISVDIPLSQVKMTDEFGDQIKARNPDQVLYGLVQPEIPEVEFSLQLPRVDRQIENIESIQATIEAVLPGRSELFRFQNVGKLKAGYEIEKAGATVTFEGVQKNEDLFGIRMSLSFDEANNALESHQSWVYQNEVYLQDSQGKREDAISLETLHQDKERVTIQYYFLKEPGPQTLVYKTPATIVKMPVQIELKKIPLP